MSVSPENIPSGPTDSGEAKTPRSSTNGTCQNHHARHYHASRPTIAKDAGQMQSRGSGELLKSLLSFLLIPPLWWGLCVSSLPVYEEISGFSWKNFAASYFFLACGVTGSYTFYVVARLYYPSVTLRMWLISSMGSYHIWVIIVAVIEMALDRYPFSFHVLYVAFGWWPCMSGTIYLQLARKGLIIRTRDFFKLCGLLLSFFMYFSLCAFYMLVMLSFSGDAEWQMVCSGVFTIVSFLFKNQVMNGVPHFIPPHAYETSGSPEIVSEDARDSSLRLGVFFAYEMCQELFVTFSFSSVTDITSAMFMIALEISPLILFRVRMNKRYFNLMKGYTKSYTLNMFSYNDYCLMAVERFSLQVLAELASTVGFLIVIPVWRFGWNRDFFPLRSACHSEFTLSFLFVALQLVLVVPIVAVQGRWLWKRYSISVSRVLLAHLVRNGELLLTLAMMVYYYPFAVLFRHSNIVPLVSSEDMYTPDPDC